MSDKLTEPYDPSEMPEGVSPAVAQLRAFIEELIEREVSHVNNKWGEEVSLQIRKSLRRVTRDLFHKNTVHEDFLTKGEPSQFDDAIKTLFGFDGK